MYYLDPKIETLYRIFDQNARKDFIRLDLNENPGGLPQEFIDKVLSQVDGRFVGQYPETLQFTEKLAKFLGTDIQHLSLIQRTAALRMEPSSSSFLRLRSSTLSALSARIHPLHWQALPTHGLRYSSRTSAAYLR